MTVVTEEKLYGPPWSPETVGVEAVDDVLVELPGLSADGQV